MNVKSLGLYCEINSSGEKIYCSGDYNSASSGKSTKLEEIHTLNVC